jgi:hypothetical protein
MMKKHTIILLLLLFLGIMPVISQNLTLTGKVKNQDGGLVF